MGRKIRPKRHHGVKDPLKQQQQRYNSIKSKINAPPTDPDEQPVPKSLTRLFEFKERQEQRHKTKKNKTKMPVTHYNEEEEKSSNPVSSLKRLPGESSRSFNQRINNAVQSINKRHLQTQQMEASQNPDHYLPQEDAREERHDYIQRKKLQRKQKARSNGEDEPKLSRMQRWTMKKKEKRSAKEEQKEENFEPKYETVKFGEVAHEPPSLHVKPRRAPLTDGAPRPGRKDLLLNKLLSGNPQPGPVQAKQPRITVTKSMAFDKKVKRKSLPVGVRMRLEQSQQEAIEAYRAIKKESLKNKA